MYRGDTNHGGNAPVRKIHGASAPASYAIDLCTNSLPSSPLLLDDSYLLPNIWGSSGKGSITTKCQTFGGSIIG